MLKVAPFTGVRAYGRTGVQSYGHTVIQSYSCTVAHPIFWLDGLLLFCIIVGLHPVSSAIIKQKVMII